MQVLQNMDPDKMIIIFPTALIAMYLIIKVQKFLCERPNPYAGLALPAICFVVSTILAVRPLFIADAGEFDGLVTFCLRMWLTFNISTLVFLFPYYRHRRYMRAVAKAQLQEPSQEESQEEPQNDLKPE
ncbi:MAG: hypothetical protein GX663_10335 [Clostridiales bacterium]|nr:hypothetical protein [Clostridiales bacterium]